MHHQPVPVSVTVNDPISVSLVVNSSSGGGAATERASSGMVEMLPKYKRDLNAKIKALRMELQLLQPRNGHCRIEVTRKEIFEQSYRQVLKLRVKDLRKRLMVKFKGEEGLDYGGIAREWLHLLSHEMLNPSYGLFQYSHENQCCVQINPDSGVHPVKKYYNRITCTYIRFLY